MEHDIHVQYYFRVSNLWNMCIRMRAFINQWHINTHVSVLLYIYFAVRHGTDIRPKPHGTPAKLRSPSFESEERNVHRRCRYRFCAVHQMVKLVEMFQKVFDQTLQVKFMMFDCLSAHVACIHKSSANGKFAHNHVSIRTWLSNKLQLICAGNTFVGRKRQPQPFSVTFFCSAIFNVFVVSMN